MRHVSLAFQTRIVVASTALLVAPATARYSWAQEQGQVFVANYYGDSVTLYPLPTTGNKLPAAVIPAVKLNANPFQIAINHRTGELIVANSGVGGVSVYDRATGTLKRTIDGPSTALRNPTGVAIDEGRLELYVANFGAGSITVYDAQASGDVSPKRTITSSAMITPVGLAFDASHDEILVSDYLYESILTFDRSATGPSDPTRQIHGGGLKLPKGIALDLNRGEILVANNSSDQSLGTGAILVFSRTDPGDPGVPLRKLEGGATGLCDPYSVVIDYLKDEIVVANANFGLTCTDAVTTYDRSATGNVPPKRMIAGASTLLNRPAWATIYYGASLAVANKAASTSVGRDSTITYNITATANGGSVLDAMLSDLLPTAGGLSWKLEPAVAGCTLVDNYRLTCSFANLVKGQSKSITVSATTSGANCSSSVSNQATFSYNDGTAILSGASPVSTVNVKCKN